ncbi:MAG TPA: hypothetical protein PKZ78_11450, partial [Candidatus Goldiibacteriota bacterium]|nr:hypothetical protein [Candidatus Goldiibacteriota bacterium]
VTQTNTQTVTQTNTQTVTGTNTRTNTQTVTQTNTQTATGTVTRTNTQTATGTITQTNTKTVTQTVTGTITRTSTTTITFTITVTATPTSTRTVTLTNTKTVTGTSTGTVTRTNTQTVTQTNTQTVTGTMTRTVTQTVTQTVTPTITITATPTATPSSTPTMVTGSLLVEAPDTVTAGSAFFITVTAKTTAAYGDLTAENYEGTIHFTTSASLYNIPGDYTYVATTDFGVHIFQVIINNTGTQSITATDISIPSITGSDSFNVVSAMPTNFTVSAPSDVTAGGLFYITVTAKDSFNNVVTGYTGQVNFTTTDPYTPSGMPADLTFLPSYQGVTIVAVTLYTKGIQRIYVADTSETSINGTSNEINVHAGSLHHFVVVAPSFVNSGAVFNFVTTAKDQFNNTIDNYTGTVAFTSGAASKTLPANYTFQAADNGTRIFDATIVTAGTWTITATDTGNSMSGTSNNILVSDTATSYNQPVMLTAYLAAANTYSYCYVNIDDNDNYTLPVNAAYLMYDLFVPDTSSNFYTSMEVDGNWTGGQLRDFEPYIM